VKKTSCLNQERNPCTDHIYAQLGVLDYFDKRKWSEICWCIFVKKNFNAGTIIMDDGLVFLARSDGLKCLFEEFVSYKCAAFHFTIH